MHGLGGLGFGMFYQGRTESRDVMQDYSVCHSSKKMIVSTCFYKISV